MTLDVTTIILTFNEELHIRRCLENVCPFSKKVYVIDSPSTDHTADICREFENVEVVVHKYPGNQAEQFNWALDNLEFDTEWILRVDADEYCESELIDEMRVKLPTLDNSVSAVVVPIGREFMERRLHHGIVNGVCLTRMMRKGKCRYELRLMDEYLNILNGTTVRFEHSIVDASRIGIKSFIDKHNNYSSREASLLLDAEYGLCECSENTESGKPDYAKEVAAKRRQKVRYAKMPLFWRSLGYFVYRYVVKLGFLDGWEGFCWDFFQGLWYRMLVDVKVYEVRKNCALLKAKGELDQHKKDVIKQYIKTNWNINL